MFFLVMNAYPSAELSFSVLFSIIQSYAAVEYDKMIFKNDSPEWSG